jgi:hypothetical protein
VAAVPSGLSLTPLRIIIIILSVRWYSVSINILSSIVEVKSVIETKSESQNPSSDHLDIGTEVHDVPRCAALSLSLSLRVFIS